MCRPGYEKHRWKPGHDTSAVKLSTPRQHQQLRACAHGRESSIQASRSNPDKNTEIDASRTAAGAFTATVPGACEDVMHASTFVSL